MFGKIKDQKSKIKNTYQILKRGFFVFLIFLLVFFLLLNIFASQKISQLYFQLINNNRQATVAFLKKINKLPLFSFFLNTNIKIYDRWLENEVFSEQRMKEEEMAQLQALLTKNPKSRDIIYRLYLLNKDLGNNQQAGKYLRMVKEIDPNIN